MTVAVVVAVVVIVAVAVAVGLVLRTRTSSDGVDSFRRQIDALSPEARRPTVDQVKNVERPGDDEPEDQ
ncbi:MAG: hypothetical protein HKN44_12450 [Ilumatobacter sp.]|nr:hypothetical protein [Ilumatobacter sp.]